MMTPTARRTVPGLFALLLLATIPAIAQERFPAEPDLIEIMFIQPSVVRLIGDEPVDLSGLDAVAGLEPLLAPLPHEWSRMSDVPEAVLDDLEAAGEAATGEDLYNLNNILRLRIFAAVDAWTLAADIEALPGVHQAYPVPLPQALPIPGSFVSQQGYLNTAASTPTGIDAQYAWTQPGGTGAGVTVCDIEYDWNYNHQDVTQASVSQINTLVSDPFAATAPSAPHGTGVIGELSSDANGWGTIGVCYGASLLTCGAYYGFPAAWNPAGAIALATSVLQAGDVILLEQQWDYSGTAATGLFIPLEWYGSDNTPSGIPFQTQNAVYIAIQTAVANGIHVVEAGGNGNFDTDTIVWLPDSGAIIVGAGGAATSGDLVRMSFSSYGSRFHVQAWGEDVVTTGWNSDLWNESPNLQYTRSFNGTSSASPIVAAAAACLQGWWSASGYGAPISPQQMRTTLMATGTPQNMSTPGNIGPRPDLAAAMAALVPQNWADATAGPLGDTGQTWSCAWADYDTDGDPDIYLTNWGAKKPTPAQRNGAGVFTDVTSGPEGRRTGTSQGAAWADYDNDGDPDPVRRRRRGGATSKLLRKDGGVFTDGG